ncbi:MAG: tRNA (adenosine(37)-N6)-threonylcarbamoyltransferase complex ATPase subunit type 1 TsaE [Minwuia sp.]|nr:tRNA (adenosine(37)-N6)-threonylcarbamoyltransferase complex ATPase subunit type 1 TsaE [Minwuia sp.]
MITRDIPLDSMQATQALGQRLSDALQVGDALLLSGDLGAGKTELARAIIRARAGQAIDVPSPTFNLVIPYEFRDLLITHFDLYRLEGADDVIELGFQDALDDGSVIVEWPDRLGDLTPPEALRIDLTAVSDRRQARVSGPAAIVERFLGA